MKIPEQVTVGPLIFDVHDDTASWHEAMILMEKADVPQSTIPFGYTQMVDCVIWLGPGLSPTQKRLTLVHELMHVFLHLADVDLSRLRPAVDAEEVFLEAVTPWMTITLVQNPELLAMFLPGVDPTASLAQLAIDYGAAQAQRVNSRAGRRGDDPVRMASAPGVFWWPGRQAGQSRR